MDKMPSSNFLYLKSKSISSSVTEYKIVYLPLLMKPALESLLELPQSTTINTLNKKLQQGSTKYRTFQFHKKIKKDERVWGEEKKCKGEHMQEQEEQITDLLRLLTMDWSVGCEVGLCSLLKELALGQKGARTTAYRGSFQRVEDQKHIKDTDKT